MRLLLLPVLTLLALPAYADSAPVRARDLGIPFVGVPGPLNAITDVAGVTVGHETIIRDLPDNRAVRTGVTAILPRGHDSMQSNVYAGWWALNGNGEMTGTTWVEEGGLLEGPVMITNTHSVGAVHEGVIQWRVAHGSEDGSGYFWSNPVVAETWDGDLNDINGFHVRPAHAGAALDRASGGAVDEGSVGGGTGMTCFDFKCGIGTSSRVAVIDDVSYTLGVLVQANFGARHDLRVAGIPVGEQFPDHLTYSRDDSEIRMQSSIIVVVATDAPLLPYQLKRLARRISLAVGVTGDIGMNSSGDIFMAFSTANAEATQARSDAIIHSIPNGSMNPLFAATVHASEEAIINALIAGRDMRGDLGYVVKAIDHEKLQAILRQHGRLAATRPDIQAIE